MLDRLDDAADAGGLLEQQNGDAQLSQPVRARQPGDAATDHNGLRGSMHGVRAFAAGLLKGIGTEQRAGLQLQSFNKRAEDHCHEGAPTPRPAALTQQVLGGAAFCTS